MNSTSYRDTINTIIESIKFENSHSIRLNEKRFNVSNNSNINKWDRPYNSFGSNTTNAQDKILYRLTEIIYKVYYSSGMLDAEIDPIFNLYSDIPDLENRSQFMDHLSEYNHTENRVDPFWSIVNIPNNARYTVKKNKEIRNLHYSQVAQMDHPFQIFSDEYVHVFQSKEDRYKQNIFYHCYGDQWIEEDKSMFRFYFNIEPNHVHKLIDLVTDQFNFYKIPFCMKCLNHPDFYPIRADTAVVYLQRIHHHLSWQIIKPIIEELKGHLLIQTPIFTLKICDGVGFAESPIDYSSFGWNRCETISLFIYDLYFKSSSFNVTIEEYFKEQGISIDSIYLNGLSGYSYNFEI